MLKKFKEYISSLYEKYKVAIYSSAFLTFITHLFFFTQKFINEDDLGYFNFVEDALSSGRWLSGNLIMGNSQLPVVRFLFIIVIMVIITTLICDLFKIKNKRSMFLIALILSTFPSLAVSFSYLFMIESYLISLFFAALSVYLTIKLKWGFVVGSILISLSLGCYQSYIGVASALSLIYLIKMFLDKKEIKEIIVIAVKFLAMGIIGVLLYFIILKIVLYFKGEVLSTYKGANEMGIPPIREWPHLIYRTYLHFIGYFIGISFFKTSKIYILFRIIAILSSAYMLFNLIVSKKLYKNKVNLILLIILLCALPFAINIVDFFAYNTEISTLNIFQFATGFVFFIILLDYINLNEKNIISIVGIICVVVLSFIGWDNFITTNRYYMKVKVFNDYTYSLNTRLLSRIEATEGYKYDMPIMIVEQKDSEFYKMLYDISPWENVINYDQAFWGRYIGYEDLYYFNNEEKVINIIGNTHGVDLKCVTTEQKEKIEDMEEFKTMSLWPSMEAIKIIDNVLVIKM